MFFHVKVILNKSAFNRSQFLSKVVHFKQAAVLVLGICADFCYLSLRCPINFFLDPPFVYIKIPFPINKQFSTDSFLDWEGHSWVFAHLNQITAMYSLVLRIANILNYFLDCGAQEFYCSVEKEFKTY